MAHPSGSHSSDSNEPNEQHWYLLRSVYANPADPRLFVPRRFLMAKPSDFAVTPNLGNWRAWLVMTLALSPVIVMSWMVWRYR